MATLPVGEDKWVDYVAEHSRHANDLEKRVHAIELFKLAVEAEPNSVKVWRAYCEYFWSLYIDSQSHESGWSDEERHMGCELFSLNAALSLWQQGYEAILYRISDSHELWDQWIALESGLLARSRTAEGIRRITYLYTDRLQVPHVTRDNTAQAFSEFLSTYNKAVWEETMQSVTANVKSQEAKKLTEDRDMFELKLKQAQRENKDDVYRTLLKEYLEWECAQSKRSNKHPEATGDLCRGLYARALTGVYAFDDTIWNEYVRFLSTSGTYAQSPQGMVDVLRRAVDHCPWSGAIWSRYILTAEDAKLPFNEIEQIKHKATSNPELYKNGMAALLDMYAAWCGFLKRKAMDLNATDEDVDIADMGLRAALEFVDQAKHRYGDSYRGDPNFRLERIYIQYLTEKKHFIDEARSEWHKLAEKQLYADSYDFWLNYYLWEMMIFASNGKDRSPTPSTAAIGLRVPSVATAVLGRAIKRKTLDWPERVIDVYVQHCNDYELPSTVRIAIDTVYETRKEVAKRREREAAQAAEYYAAQTQEQQAAYAVEAADDDSSLSSKRKREDEADVADVTSSKRAKSDAAAETETLLKQQSLKRDRENTSVLVSKLPAETTKTKIRQYFKEYGHLVDVTDPAIDPQDHTQTVMVEFRTPEEAQSALLRDGKYFGTSQISVQPGTDLTVYVTNYPPTADKTYLSNLFQDCGDILGIRMPSLKGNVRRRFSYITFQDRAASAKATQKHGTVLDGKFKLMAMYSDPSRAKKREGAIEEGRELHITDLDPAAVEDDVEKVFSKYGTVKRINIPRNKAGKGHGVAYVEMESKDQAQTAASELDKAKLRNSIMSVQISTPSIFKRTAAISKEGASPAPSRDEEGDQTMADSNGDASQARQAGPNRAEIASRTIALLGIPDTVNDARVKEIVEKVGGFKSLILQPSHGGAKIEFEDEPSAGRAALQLDGYVLDGRKLRTGSVEELKHSKGEMRTEKIVYGAGGKKQGDKPAAPRSGGNGAAFIPPPTAVKRPVLGKGGAKRGLGFLPKAIGAGGKGAGASQTEAKVNGAGGGETEIRKPMKSNADFKALVLGTNASKEGGAERNGNGQAGQDHH
ncbi:hypothetical protein EsH8_V_000918 [Colletotrichum jinshuiense]